MCKSSFLNWTGGEHWLQSFIWFIFYFGVILDKHIARLPIGVAIAVSLIIAWVVGQSIAAMFQQNLAVVLPNLKSSQKVVQLSGEDSFLFGKPEFAAQASKPREITENAAKTKLNLKLIGMIDLGDQGVAIIQSGSKTIVVKHNETIMPNVVLLDVFSDGILIDNNGKAERLIYDQAVTSLIAEAKTNAVPVASARVGRLSLAEQNSLNDIGAKLRKEPMSISKYIRFQPINENGQWVGVRINSNSDPDLYKNLGFGEGDILRQVNGHSIQDMAKDPKLWQTFLSSDQFDLVVDRDGAPQMINVNFR